METFDREALGRLAKALAFIRGADHPVTAVMKRAAETGAEADIKKARAAFMKLKPGERQAAFAMLQED
ncbi:conserved hypothetical protein [uncultured Alphaproteobacteria bacterium]|jgi:hypothetical protein|uniref:Uncharacterized protein n=1 Tax=uncultured Alphaproteobacteria bacterium TaxID=91750 RepID=A0A212KJH0_9PROT|nr:conserved hypothetical protein [uncultured Alphaproteobacteria bacterium]